MSNGVQIILNVCGDPKGQPRPRAFAFNGHVRVYDCGTAEGWKSLIATEWRKQTLLEGVKGPLQGPLSVDIVFGFRRPKAHYRTGKHSGELRPDAPTHHTSKPDRDNLDKAVLDALTQCGAFEDDSQVCHGTIQKFWSEKPGAKILITTLAM